MTARYNYSDNTLKEISQMEKPLRRVAQFKSGSREYFQAVREWATYNAHIASLRTLSCHPSAKTVWKEGDVLTQNKDYNLYKICAVPGGCFDDLACGTCEVQAWPVAVKSEDLWDDVVTIVAGSWSREKIITELKEKFVITRKQ